MSGAIASIAPGGRGVEGSALYWQDKIFYEHWKNAAEMGYVRLGPWSKHPWDDDGNVVNRRPWLPIELQIKEALNAQKDAHANYDVFYKGNLAAGIGDIFRPHLVDRICIDYDINPTPQANKALGIDPAFSSSQFAVIGLEERDKGIHVILAEAYDKPLFSEMVAACANLYFRDGYNAMYVDASNPEFIRESANTGAYIEPVPFNKELPDMIGSAIFYVEQQQLWIDRGFPQLIEEMKNARFREGLKSAAIDKPSGGLTFDRLDALLCGLRHWARKGSPAAASKK